MFYILKMGGTHSSRLCALAVKLWELCCTKGIWLSASHIPGKLNREADYLSRHPSAERQDYGLTQSLFDRLLLYLDLSLEVDLFASKESHKLERYMSRSWDAEAIAIDAFSTRWEGAVYLFPPINLLTRAVDKFISDKVNCGVLITPLWPGLPILPVIFELLMWDPIFILSSGLMGSWPTRHKFHLMAWLISSLPVKTQIFQRQCQRRCLKALNQAWCNFKIDLTKLMQKFLFT